VLLCLLILDYYPKCLTHRFRLAKRLKKLYFFQIFKERKTVISKRSNLSIRAYV
jgi:hypothetical protein